VEQKYASLALRLLTVVLLAVIAFELANPAKAPVYAPFNPTDYTSEIQILERQLNTANSYLQDICRGVSPTSRVTTNYCNH